jgi:hypothetical protein
MRSAVVVGVILAIGCQETSEPQARHATRPDNEDVPASATLTHVREDAAQPQPPPALEPVTVIVAQRSTSALPIPDEDVLLTVDDVTGGQVMASLSREDGTPLHAPVSLQTGDELAFEVGGRSFQLQLVKLRNLLVGEDAAEFLLSSPHESSHSPEQSSPASSPAAEPPRLSEAEKIERLIEAVARQSDAVFVRNGREHSAAEAGEHLRRKWKAADDRVTTAEEFIEHIASHSSLSGSAYSIRFSDGSEMTSAEFLRVELRKLESTSQE